MRLKEGRSGDGHAIKFLSVKKGYEIIVIRLKTLVTSSRINIYVELHLKDRPRCNLRINQKSGRETLEIADSRHHSLTCTDMWKLLLLSSSWPVPRLVSVSVCVALPSVAEYHDLLADALPGVNAPNLVAYQGSWSNRD